MFLTLHQLFPLPPIRGHSIITFALRGGGGPSKCEPGGGELISTRKFTYKFLKCLFIQTLKRKKRYKTEQELWLKVEKRLGTV